MPSDLDPNVPVSHHAKRRGRRKKITANLDREHTLTLTGRCGSLEEFCELLERLLSQAKRSKGLRLPTFLAVLADQNDTVTDT